MTFVALALVVAWAATTAALLRVIASTQRSHSRREDLLTDKLLHAAGKAWTPPPAQNTTPTPDPEPRMWTPSPEQLPLDS